MTSGEAGWQDATVWAPCEGWQSTTSLAVAWRKGITSEMPRPDRCKNQTISSFQVENCTSNRCAEFLLPHSVSWPFVSTKRLAVFEIEGAGDHGPVHICAPQKAQHGFGRTMCQQSSSGTRMTDGVYGQNWHCFVIMLKIILFIIQIGNTSFGLRQ